MALSRKNPTASGEQELALFNDASAGTVSTQFAPAAGQTGGKTKYKRLQVERIWLRALFEMVCIITAIVLCCVLIVSNYEKSYADYTRKYTADNTLQLAHSLAGMADKGAISLEEGERRDYAADSISGQLDNCFISEDMLYSGAIYKVDGEEITLFASSEKYVPTMTENKIIGSEGENGAQLAALLDAAALGEEQSVTIDDVYLSLVPRRDSDGLVYSIVAASTTYRTSLDYPSIVRGRLVWISIVCSVLIIVYYSISAARSEKKRQKATGKDVVN